MGDGGGGTRPDAISTSLCRLRRLTNECRLEEDKNTQDLLKKWGGHFLCGPHQAEKWGDASPPHPPPIYAHAGYVLYLEHHQSTLEVTGYVLYLEHHQSTLEVTGHVLYCEHCQPTLEVTGLNVLYCEHCQSTLEVTGLNVLYWEHSQSTLEFTGLNVLYWEHCHSTLEVIWYVLINASSYKWVFYNVISQCQQLDCFTTCVEGLHDFN